MSDLLNLQCMMFLMMLTGFITKKSRIITAAGQRDLTNLVLAVILPCSIIKSFMIPFSSEIMYSFAMILAIAVVIQIFCVIIGKTMFRRSDPEHWKCLYYGTICSNAGFLGNPIAEGVFGTMGLTLASIYLIPVRIMIWSSGIAIFSNTQDKKTLIKKIIFHPCMVACGLGITAMLTHFEFPEFLEKTIVSIGACNTPMSMMVIGMILGDMQLKSLWNKEVCYYSVIRLIIIPLVVYGVCRLLRIDSLITGVSVLLAAMPAGATTSIFAAQYDGDKEYATTMVVFSTLVSVVTISIWSIVLTNA